MTPFVELPIESDPGVLLEETFGELEELLTGWKVNLSAPEVLLIQAIVFRLVAPLAALAAEVPTEIFEEWGRKIVGVTAQAAQPATVKTKWTARDTAGYEIPAGTQVDVERTGSEQIGFVVAKTVFIAPGSNNVTGVLLEAVESGTAANGLTTAAAVTLIDSLGWVTTVALEATSSGGQEAEEAAHYLNRLAETMQTLVEGVVTAHDVEVVVRNIEGVGRALAIDNYNAETKATEAEKTTTVVVTDALGKALTSGKKAEIKAKLESKRETNYIFFVVDANYESIDVTVKLVPRIGYTLAEADAAAKLAIEAFLSPATFAQEPPGNAASWTNTTTLRYQDLSAIVNNVQQVDHFTELKVAKHGGTLGVVDLTLEGVAPLPEPGTIKAE